MTLTTSVAAIIPLYNQRATVSEAIESVLAQTRVPEEIIVVDDGSTDGSGDIVASEYSKHVTLIRQRNRGAAMARNLAIARSSSALLAFLDADDKWLPQKVEKQASYMERHPECMFSFSAHIYYNEELDLTRVENMCVDKATYLQKAFFRGRALPATNSVMIRRGALDEVGLFDASLRRCQDTDLWLRIMVRYGFEHIPEALVWVRRGPHQTVTKASDAFKYNYMFLEKHRHTFGHGVRAHLIWRAACASWLRMHAGWLRREGNRREAATELMRAISLWPLEDPIAWARTAALLAFGEEKCGACANILRTWLRCLRAPDLVMEARSTEVGS